VNSTLLVALVVAVIGPILLSLLQGRQRRQEIERAEKRQDKVAKDAADQQKAVAAQAAEAATLLLASQKASIGRTEEVARLAAEAASVQDTNLGEIKSLADATHLLVNSNMDEQKRIQLRGTERELATLLELKLLREDRGQEQNTETVEAIATARSTISALKQELAERAKRLEQIES